MAGEEAIIIHAIQKKIIRKFQDQCATDPRQAISLESLGKRHRSITRGLIRRKILVAVDENRFYLDEDAAEQFFKKKRLSIFLAIIAGIMIAIIAILLKK